MLWFAGQLDAGKQRRFVQITCYSIFSSLSAIYQTDPWVREHCLQDTHVEDCT
jgi:hypothetical protein